MAPKGVFISLLVCLTATAWSLPAPVPEENPPGSYLPLFDQAEWILRNPRYSDPVVFKASRWDGPGFHIVSTNPWGTSEWTLLENDGVFTMTRYGVSGQIMSLPQKPVYFDFTRKKGAKWSNSLGKFEVVDRSAVVKSGERTYRNCIHIRHESNHFIFAAGVGFVQFGEGDNAFILDEESSNLHEDNRTLSSPAAESDDLKAEKNSGKTDRKRAEQARRGVPEKSYPPAVVKSGRKPLIGLTHNRMATDPNTYEAMVKRFNQVVDTGVTYFVGNSTWKELEPAPEAYRLGNLENLVALSMDNNLSVSFTLRVIDTIYKNVPDDLKDLPWNHPRMKSRVLSLIGKIAPAFKGQVKWFIFGYEIDAYVRQHPDEVDEFVALYKTAAARIKELVPGIQVSCTLTYTGINELEGRLASLNRQMDFLALTYCPTKPDFTVEDPSVLPDDFKKMRQVAANRKIVLQEIAYPSSPVCGSSEDKQAEFYRLAFKEFAQNGGSFQSVNFMMLADLSDKDADNYTAFYGMKGASAFRSLLQSLGMFDVRGKSKKSWTVFREYMNK